ncbi:MAG: LTA synthase family protein [Bacteroidia bacterium]
MPIYTRNLIALCKHLLLLIALYAVCRCLFFLFNYSHFSELHLVELLKITIVSVRFDLSTIIITNALFILLFLLPLFFREKKGYLFVLKLLFLLVNSLCVLANCVDLAYFQFTTKRTNASVFNFFSGEIGDDFSSLLPVFLKEYWYIAIIWLLLLSLLVYGYTKNEKNKPQFLWHKKQYVSESLVFVLFLVFATVAYRGGLQLKPISVVSAGEYVQAQYIPLVINTPFSIIKTAEAQGIMPSENWKIDDKKELLRLYNPKQMEKKNKYKHFNVCVIALESFSKEYIGALNGKSKDESCTPFLDSLIAESLTFTNSFSNGKTSIEGIPSIVAGIPTWMNEPYITSTYGSNKINSIATLLKKQGYYTAFFHGGTNGTMGFDAFASLAGYDDYFGRKEYNNEKDYDGNWGIWDEEFLQYTAKTLNKKRQPFFTSIFTLSSHHPYSLPTKHQSRFKKGKLPIENVISYTDYSLMRFFESAKKMQWFRNTIFVLVADHTGVSSDVFYSNAVGNYMVPIIFHSPRGYFKGIDSTITQQIDILPSLMDFLNYPYSYFSFGNSVFNKKADRFALTFNSGMFQLIQNKYLLQFDGDNSIGFYDFSKDSLLNHNLEQHEDSLMRIQMEKKIKAIIQTYQQSLINNKMSY